MMRHAWDDELPEAASGGDPTTIMEQRAGLEHGLFREYYWVLNQYVAHLAQVRSSASRICALMIKLALLQNKCAGNRLSHYILAKHCDFKVIVHLGGLLPRSLDPHENDGYTQLHQQRSVLSKIGFIRCMTFKIYTTSI